METQSVDKKKKLIKVLFNILFDYYGPQKWWPCQTGLRWEIITGAILTQNTAWTNVEKAIGNLLSAEVMSPERVLATSDTELQELSRPAVFFTQKYAYLKAMAAFMLERESTFEQSADVWALRKELLSVKGVGRETADSILLYAFNKPIFVIDAYTRRIAERHLHLGGTLHYNTLQKIFMDALPTDVTIYNEYHAMIVAFCKESCHKAGCGERYKSLLKQEKV